MADEYVSVKTTIEFEKWQAPNFARILADPELTASRGDAISVSKLDQAALDALAEAWLDDLYRKAGKKNPFTLPVMP